MREAFRPYVKVVELTSADRVTIDLTDSSGIAFNCNYIQVSPASGTARGFFLAIPTGISTEKPVGNMLVASSITNSASGTLGAVDGQLTGSVVFSLPYNDVSNSIYLSQSNTTPTTYSIIYGNVREANSLADNRLPSGN